MSNGRYQDFLNRGKLHESGTAGYQKNYYKAFQNYVKVPSHIERGESYYRIGELLMVGDKFLARDYKEAKNFYQEAALYGHGAARYALGQIHEKGCGVDVDYANAKRYYHQALDVGYTKAAKDIGIMFLTAPSGVLYDLDRAKLYLEQFEEHYEADADVHIALGDYYRLSRCKDYISKAFERYKKAIALNEGLGYYWIGQMWEEISPKHLSKAVGYYQEGKALSNNAKCMWRLGQLYASGKVLEKDIEAACILFADAAMEGCTEAKKELDALNAEIAKGKSSKSDAAKTTNVDSKDTPAKATDVEPSSHFQPLSWDKMRKSFEANGAFKYEKEPTNQISTPASTSDEELVKIIKLPVKHNINVNNFQVRSKINKQCRANPSRLALQADSGNKSTRGYKFKTKTDLRKQLKKAKISCPLSPLHKLELSTALLQSNQAQITTALDTTNKSLFKNTMSLTLKLNQMSIENEQSTAIIDSNNRDIAHKFEQVEDSIETKYKHVCRRLDVLEKESAEKNKTIELLLAKLNTQSQQMETLMRSMERR